MSLPGGLSSEGPLRRDYHFRPLGGRAEMSIAETLSSTDSLPAKVTAVLAHALREVGGIEATPQLVNELCVADRQFLMRELAKLFDLDEVWLTATCQGCGELFDIRIVHSAMPVKLAGEGFPFANAATSAGQLSLRCPTGADQEAVCEIENESRARRALLDRCVVGAADSDAPEEFNIDALTEGDTVAVSRALEAASPELAVTVDVACPQCDSSNVVDVDPYICLKAGQTEIYDEVHRLASAYGWSEAETLALSRHRRKVYLELVDRDQRTAY